MKRILIVLLAALFVPVPVHACESTYDCAYGSVCVKRSSEYVGVCVGGYSPGNENDNAPAYNPSNRKSKRGRVCKNDYDCGYSEGLSCVIQAGYFKGVCM